MKKMQTGGAKKTVKKVDDKTSFKAGFKTTPIPQAYKAVGKMAKNVDDAIEKRYPNYTGPTSFYAGLKSGAKTLLGYKKGGVTKEHPITAFRKANEARDVVVKSSMKKMQTGGVKIKESSKDAYYKNNTQNFKEYKATTDGTVKSTRKTFPDVSSKPAMETTQSMDTTGYAKGKKSFKLTNSSVDLIDKKVYGAKPKVTVKNISRNDVKKVIGGMKSNIGNASKKK
jgi:hypothetical protein